jgi:crotonobetaine/carnitine-CoA ligase
MTTQDLKSTIDAGKWAMVSGRDVPSILRSRAERHGDKPFLIWEPFEGDRRVWSYTAFASDVEAMAGALHSRGVSIGDRVLIHLDNSPEFVISWFACARVGAVAVSTNTRSVARDMEYFAAHAGVVGAITSPGFATLVNESAPGIRFMIVTATDAGSPAAVPAGVGHERFDDVLAAGETAPPRPIDPMADLGIQFTSGTTSRPKAVLWTHANVVWGMQVNCAHMRLTSDDITQVFLPLFHTNAQSYSMLSTLWSGGTMVVQPRFSSSRFWEVAVRNGVTWASTIPFCVKAAMSVDIPDDHRFRFWGSAVRLPDVEARLGITTFGWWGMTETITQGIVGDPDEPCGPMTIGRAAAEYEISIRRPDGTQIGPGESGELFIRGIRGVSLFKEYAGNPEATASSFDADGWFATGDSIVMSDEGDLIFGDRLKDMLKVGAENVAASEIEAVIMATGLVSECAVVAQKHHMLDEVPVVFLIAVPGAGGEVAERVTEACRRDLADFKVPRSVFVVDELPRSTLEKIAKNELRARLEPITE